MAGSVQARRSWVGVWPYLPGPVLVVVIYLLTVTTGGRFLFEERFNTMQGLDFASLAADPWGSLMALHAQPPLMNILFALTDAAPDRLGYLEIVLAVAATALVVDCVRRSGGSRGSAAVAGLLYALLPGTVLYALFPYTTTVTAFFAMLTVWGISLALRRPGWGVAVSSLAMVGLFLVRASVIWLFVLGWVALLLIWLFRRTGMRRERVVGLIGAAVGIMLVVLVQSHYWSAFKAPTLSSWSGENLSNALLRAGLTDDAKARLSAQNPCFGQLVAAGAWQPVSTYPDCVSAFDLYPRGLPVLDLDVKNPPTVGTNFNAGQRVALARQWAAFARAAISDEPSAFVRIVVGNGTVQGSLAQFLGRSDVYYQTLDIQKATQPWLWNLLGIWSAAFPILAWLVVIVAALRSLLRRRTRNWLPPPFWFGAALLLAHAVPSVLGDFGENQRFRAELDPVLMAVMVIGLMSLVVLRRAPSAAEPIGDGDDGQMAIVADSKAATADGSPSTSS
jgi:hypothetical protein